MQHERQRCGSRSGRGGEGEGAMIEHRAIIGCSKGESMVYSHYGQIR